MNVIFFLELFIFLVCQRWPPPPAYLPINIAVPTLSSINHHLYIALSNLFIELPILDILCCPGKIIKPGCGSALFSKRCTFGSKSGTKSLVRLYQAKFAKTVPKHLKVCHIWLIKSLTNLMFSYIFCSHNSSRIFQKWIFTFLPAIGKYSLL